MTKHHRPTRARTTATSSRPLLRRAVDQLDASAVLERAGWVSVACILGAVVIAAVAGITWNASPYYGRTDDRHAVAATNHDVGTVPSTGGTYTVAAAPPNRVEIPRLKATAPIVKVATSADNELEIPINPKIVGWWTPGAKPGARVGTAVLAGHINYAGVTGTFSSIGTLHPGDEVDVFGRSAGKNTRIQFRVTAVRSYPKTALPYKQIFDQKTAGRLALVTCGGAFDTSTGNYLENIVVYAVPVASRTV